MPLNGSDQYPTEGWSTGKMRMAKRAPLTDPGYPYRELEGERKKRESRVSQAEPHRDLPEMNKRSALEAWTKFNQDLQARPPEGQMNYEPQNAQEAEALIRNYGHGFLRAGEKGAQELMKNLPQDIEGSRFPLDAFEGTKYEERDRMLYFKVLPKVS